MESTHSAVPQPTIQQAPPMQPQNVPPPIPVQQKSPQQKPQSPTGGSSHGSENDHSSTAPVKDTSLSEMASTAASFSIDTNGLLMIEEGFDLPPPNPQPGGKQNKKPLPRHIISVRVAGIQRYQFYSIKVSLLGYKTKQKEVLKDIVDPVLLSKGKPNLRGDTRRIDLHFDNIAIDEASHMNGRKFFLRFTLLSPEKLPIHCVDSSYFETITDRGNQKRQQKIDHSRSKISKVLRVSPRYSIVQGGQLVKVLLNQQIVAPNNVYVYFGEKKARYIYASPHRDNTIVCETPDGMADEEVEVRVSLDKGKTFMATDATMRYIPMGTIPQSEAGRLSPSSMPFIINQNEMKLKTAYPPVPIARNEDEDYYDEDDDQYSNQNDEHQEEPYHNQNLPQTIQQPTIVQQHVPLNNNGYAQQQPMPMVQQMHQSLNHPQQQRPHFVMPNNVISNPQPTVTYTQPSHVVFHNNYQ